MVLYTKELIADKEQLPAALFVETSELLGIAQSELKEKYGQYLGDEFNEGSSSGINDTEEHSATSHDEEHHAHEMENEITEAGHEHESYADEGVSSTEDKSGYQAVIEKYAHNHEDSDIGVMGKQDPKALMKRSIANMWQAELHLMLSQPEQALPYEEQALKFLKMAKKAERIYVKRLGFEPPPVSEQRRYLGELDEILTYHQTEKGILSEEGLSDDENNKINHLFILLNNQEELLALEGISHVLTEKELAVVANTNTFMQKKLAERPGLVEFVAILERILLAESLYIADCDNCIKQLKSKLWQLLQSPVAKASVSRKAYLSNDQLMQQYQQFLLTTEKGELNLSNTVGRQ